MYGKLFIFIILILIDISIGRCCANFRLIFAYIIILICHYVMLQTHWHIWLERVMLLPLIVWQMLLPCFHLLEQMLSPYLAYVYQEADVIAFCDYIGRCYCQVTIYIAIPNMHITVVRG